MDRFACGIELKFAADAPEGAFSGYGAVFGNVDGYGDVIANGAFRESLSHHRKSKRMPPMLLQHGGGLFGGGAEDMTPIGVWTEMEEDEKGLRVEGRLAVKTRRGADALELLRMEPRPALNGLSIGYRVKQAALGTKPGEPNRTLQKIELIEVSLVTLPANDLARVDQVKAIDDIGDLRDAESLLREAGFSKAAACAFVSRVKTFGRGEPGTEPDEIAAMLRRNMAILKGTQS